MGPIIGFLLLLGALGGCVSILVWWALNDWGVALALLVFVGPVVGMGLIHAFMSFCEWLIMGER